MYIPKPMKKEVFLKDNLFILRFTYDAKVVEQVKTLNKPKDCWDKTNKIWKVNASLFNLSKIRGFGFDIDTSIIDWEKNFKKQIPNPIFIKPLIKVKEPLRSYQEEGVAFIEKANGRCLIADQMGLGKTVQTIAWLTTKKDELKDKIVIVVCPASVKYNWKKEIERWSDLSCVILEGRTPYPAHIKRNNIIIINYDILQYWIESLSAHPIFVIVSDECHFTKNTKALRTKALRKLSKKSHRFIGLSGTPIKNKPSEFFTTLNIIDKNTFPSFWTYAQKYCAAKHNGYGWNFDGASNIGELHTLLEGLMIRRLKKDVEKDLPDKQVSVIPLPLQEEEKLEYQYCKDNFVEYMGNYSSADQLVKIEELKQISLRGKMNGVVEWIDSFLEEEDEKLVIFCTHHKAVDYLYNKYKSMSVVLDGRTKPADRQTVVDQFQTNPRIRVFIGNIKAAGVGITLTASSTVCFIELGWNPGDHLQAEDRVHRIGQKNNVNIYYLVAEDTIEEDILEIIDRKNTILNAVLDGIQTPEESMLGEILRRMKGETQCLERIA